MTNMRGDDQQPTAKAGHDNAMRIYQSVCSQLAPCTREHSSISNDSCVNVPLMMRTASGVPSVT